MSQVKEKPSGIDLRVHAVKEPPRIHKIAPSERNLRRRGMFYLLISSQGKPFRRWVYTHLFTILWRYTTHWWYRCTQEGDFHYYGISSSEEWKEKSANAVVVIGFSYCEKPLACPEGRFNDRCSPREDAACQECGIGALRTRIPAREGVYCKIIPTVHDIGLFLIQLQKEHPNQPILFLITACPLSLHMFERWAMLLGVRGIGVELHGRICNTFQAFLLSEQGIKPGRTSLISETYKKMQELVEHLHT